MKKKYSNSKLTVDNKGKIISFMANRRVTRSIIRTLSDISDGAFFAKCPILDVSQGSKYASGKSFKKH